MANNLLGFLFALLCASSVAAGDLDWWQTGIIYQIYPYSFKDSNGDGFGDINGITQMLEYIKGMEVKGISLPLMKGPLVAMNSEVSDFTDIDPILGNLDDFKRLINKSNELDIKVILEFIPNHSSDKHPWFNKSIKRVEPYTDYYVWADGKPAKTKRSVPVFNTVTNLHSKQHNGAKSVDTPATNSTVNSNGSLENVTETTPMSVTKASTSKTTQSKTLHTNDTSQKIIATSPANSTVNGTVVKNSKVTPITTEASMTSSTKTTLPINTTSSIKTTLATNTTSSTKTTLPISTTSSTKTTLPISTTSSNKTTLPSVHVSGNKNSSNTSTSVVTPQPSSNSTYVVHKNSTTGGKVPSKKGHMLPPNNWVSKAGGSAWQWNEERQQFYLHQSTVSRPDLNYRNPHLIKEMKDVLTFWLDIGVHGFRLVDVPILFEARSLLDEPQGNDSLASQFPYNMTGYWNLSHTKTMDQPETYNMVAQWRQLLDNYTTNSTDDITRVLIIDGMATTSDSLLYYGNSNARGGHLVLTCNFICEPKEWQAAYIDLLIRWWEDSTPAGHPIAWMAGNQNVARVGNRFPPELIDIVNIMLLLLPGVPFTYYGEEIGMENTFISWEQTRDKTEYNVTSANYQFFSKDPARTPFQWNMTTSAGFSTNATTWLPVNPNYKILNQKTQSQVDNSHYNVYIAVAKLRRLETVQRGEYKPHVFSERVFGFSRTLEDYNSVVVVINLDTHMKTVNLLQMKGAKERMCVYITSNANLPDPVIVQVENLALPPSSSLVLTEECRKDWNNAGTTVSGVSSLLLLLLCTLRTLHNLIN